MPNGFDEILQQWVDGKINLNVPYQFAFDVAKYNGKPESDRYNMGTIECRICGYKHNSSWPVDISEPENQQCPNCEHFASEPVSDCYREISLIDGRYVVGDYWYA